MLSLCLAKWLAAAAGAMLAVCGMAGTTDAGTGYSYARIPTNGVSYITGQPAAPMLTARISCLPEWMHVSWGGTLTTERPNQRFALDNRTLSAATTCGSAEYDITAALANEIVGGKLDLRFSVVGAPHAEYSFFIRGKNPLDATARAYIDENVDAEFQGYAWMIAKHESKSWNRVYNQFNAKEDSYKELPFKGDGASNWGWGICQIDRGSNNWHTAEIYDWHENVAAMNATLRQKASDYERFIGYYRNAYQNDPSTQWIEPTTVSTNMNGYIVSAKMWGVMTLYNGAENVPRQTIPGVSPRVRSPLQFNPATTNWIFHTNIRNYVPVVLGDRNGSEVE